MSCKNSAFQDLASPVQPDVHYKFNKEFVNMVVSGLVRGGVVKVGQTLWLGPDRKNGYKTVAVKNTEMNILRIEVALPGQFICLSLKSSNKKESLEGSEFRKGMVLGDPAFMPKFGFYFEADVRVLNLTRFFRQSFESVMYCGNVRQSVQVVKMDKLLLEMGEIGKVVFS